jgi:4-amino-4-deoxy-L-arabinose transferase-like glycosyltransferase
MGSSTSAQMQSASSGDPAPRLTRGLAVIAVGFFLLEWLPAWHGPAGYFIDEYYYFACSDRLAFGYVDHPPLSIWLLRLVRTLLGDSLPAVRLVPALAAAATVLITGDLARRLGARTWGQCLAGAAVAAAPVAQTLFGFYSMNALAVLFWTACFWLVVEIELRKEPRLWLAVGAVAGLALENKHTVVLLALGLGAGMLASRARRRLASRWLWAGVGVALVCGLPNLIWQQTHGWPSLEFYRAQDLLKNNPTPALEVLWQQVLAANPLSLPIWLSGLALLLRREDDRDLRHLGIAYLVLLALLMAGGKSRPDRIAAVYPLLFAAGGAFLEARLASGAWRAARVALPVAVVGAGIALAPLTLPLLPPETAARYTQALGVVPQLEAGEGKRSELPQWLADRYGWEQLLADVEAVVQVLGVEERSGAFILAAGYGQAAPLEFLGRNRGLPPIYSGHNSYYLWGPPPDSVRLAIVVGYGDEGADGSLAPDPGLAAAFDRIELARVHRCRWCMRWRDRMPIWIARGLRRPPSELWPQVRHFQ